MTKRWWRALVVAAAIVGTPAMGQIVKLDVTVRSEPGAGFSAPIFTFTNLSSSRLINRVSIDGGPPWDFVYDGPAGPYQILNPAGGTRTLLTGEESSFDPNNGCTSSIAYGLSSFNPGDTFRFSPDPEAGGCGSAVVDIRPFLNADLIGISIQFDNGLSLSGTDWTKETIDPRSGDSDSNQLYRLTLTALDAVGAVPEPATWGMMLVGFGAVGFSLRRRTTRRAGGSPAMA